MSTAASQAHAAIVALLVEQNADVNAANSSGYTAIHQAALRGHYDLVQLLIYHRANVLAQTNFGRTAETLAQSKAHHAVADILNAVTLSTANCVAFAMGLHERLGVRSTVVCLDPEVLRMVLQYVDVDV